jgi:PAS domain S-box-containing protein
MAANKETILIIEDDSGLIELLNEQIESYGFQTVCVLSGEEAFVWLIDHCPYLIVLDYGLPDMNGKEFISELKTKNKQLPPFIVATGQGDERIAVKMMKLGARDYVIKDSHFLEMIPLIVSKVCSEIENENKLKQVEQALRDSESRFNLFMNYLPATVFLKDKDGRTLFVNRYMDDVLGASEWVGKNMTEVFPNEFGAKLFADDMTVMKSGYMKLEEDVLHLNGELHNYETQKFVIPGTGQEPLLGGISFDITERKHAEEELRISEEKFRSITEQIDEYISISDTKGFIYYASPTSKSMLQYDPDEVIGRHYMEFIDEESLPVAVEAFRLGIQDNKKAVNIELKLKRKDGSVFIGELNGTKVRYGNEDRILVIVRNITERKQAEEALKESEDKYRTMIEYSNDLIWMTDRNGDFTFLNKIALKTIGINQSDWIGKSFLPFIFKEDIPKIKDIFNRTINGIPCSYELALKKTNETIFHLSINTSPIYILGKIVGAVNFGQDITERKRVEAALRESEELYRNLVEKIPDGIYKSTEEGMFVEVNPAMVKMMGYSSKEELMKINIKKQLYFDMTDRETLVLNQMQQEMSTFRLKKKDGSCVWVEDHAWYNKDEKGNIIFHEGAMRDITDRKLAEDALLQNETNLKKMLNASSELIAAKSESIDYAVIADKFLEISGASYVCFNIYDENGLDFTTVALSGEKEIVRNASSYLGFEIINRKWKYDPERAIKNRAKNITFFGSVNEFSCSALSKKVSAYFGKTVKLGNVYVVNIIIDDKYIGDFTLIYAKGESLRNNELIELFSNQVGLFLERKKTEEALNEKMDELLRFHRLTVGRELTMIELKKEVNELLKNGGKKAKYNIVG